MRTLTEREYPKLAFCQPIQRKNDPKNNYNNKICPLKIYIISNMNIGQKTF